MEIARRKDAIEPAKACPGNSIMIVDDEEDIIELLKVTLRVRYPDIRVISARNGREAIDNVDGLDGDNFPKLILIDYNMPCMRGDETCAKLKERGIKFVSVLMTAMHRVPESVAGLFDYTIQKPVPVDVFFDMIEKHAIHAFN
jgi:CheY-like chemotaxis protein